jgi:hypothetical protein
MSFASTPLAILHALAGADDPVPLSALRKRLPHVPLILLRFHLARMAEAGVVERVSGERYRLPQAVIA